MKRLLTLTALAAVLACPDANASGFYLKEQSASAQGNAFAGATAGAEDISYSFYNPAALAKHAGTHVYFGGTWISPRSTAKNATNEFGDRSGYVDNIVHAAMSPHFYLSHQLNDRFTAGISLNVPYGMITKYDSDWAGRLHGTVSKVTAVTVTPMAAYKATDKLSLGAGMQLQYIKAILRNGVRQATPLGAVEDNASLKGDTFDIGYQLGALYEFTPQTRVGLGYRSQIRHKLKGDVSFDGAMGPGGMLSQLGALGPNGLNQDISARLTTPASFTAGIYHEINDRWAVMAEYSRVYWSSFKNLNIVGENTPNLSFTEENWKDTDFYALGANYQIDNQWKLRLGLALDKSAVGDEYRTPRIPDANRIWYSVGLEYQYNERLTFNLGYTYIHADKSKVNLRGDHLGDANRGAMKADYSNRVNIFAFSLNYNF